MLFGASTRLTKLPMLNYHRVRISTLPPLFFIKALILQGFFVSGYFWSPIWSPIFSLAPSGALRMVVGVLDS